MTAFFLAGCIPQTIYPLVNTLVLSKAGWPLALIQTCMALVRLRRTEHGNHTGQCSLSAGPHVHGLGSEPDGVDANHWARPRIKHAQASGSEADHFTVTDLSPGGAR